MGMPPTHRIQEPIKGNLNSDALPQKCAGKPMAHLASKPIGKSQLLVCG
jgi:hypothetical protein